MVVGSGHGDTPKYMGEGVASHGTPGTLGGPYHINHINYGHSGLFLRRLASYVPHLKHVILFVDVTSFNNAVMSYVMSQHCTCIGHMTVYYKRAMSTSVEEFQLVRQFVRLNSVTRDPCEAGV